MATILYADADVSLSSAVPDALVKAGFAVVVVYNWSDALTALQADIPQLVLVDWHLPDIQSMAALSALRRATPAPIVAYTAAKDDESIVAAFRYGIDGYVVKPTNLAVLCMRLHAILRRCATAQQDSLPPRLTLTEGMRFHPRQNKIVSKEGRCIRLTPVEGRILQLLAMHPGHIFSATRILEYVRGYNHASQDSVVKSHIQHLRDKLAVLPEASGLIQTTPRLGYALQVPRPGSGLAPRVPQTRDEQAS